MILLIISIIHNIIIQKHLLKYSQETTLFNVVAKYCRFPLLETSVKIPFSGQLIGDRYTITFLYKDIAHILPKMLDQLEYPEEALEFVEKNVKSGEDDIILGIDGTTKKIYVDYGSGKISIKCLEFKVEPTEPIRQESHDSAEPSQTVEPTKPAKPKPFIPAGGRMKFYKIATLSEFDKWINRPEYGCADLGRHIKENIRIVGQKFIAFDPHKVVGYHVQLNYPVFIKDLLMYLPDASLIGKKFMNDRVYWISFSDKDYTLYTRPWLPHLQLYEYYQYAMLIIWEILRGLWYVLTRAP